MHRYYVQEFGKGRRRIVQPTLGILCAEMYDSDGNIADTECALMIHEFTNRALWCCIPVKSQEMPPSCDLAIQRFQLYDHHHMVHDVDGHPSSGDLASAMAAICISNEYNLQ